VANRVVRERMQAVSLVAAQARLLAARWAVLVKAAAIPAARWVDRQADPQAAVLQVAPRNRPWVSHSQAQVAHQRLVCPARAPAVPVAAAAQVAVRKVAAAPPTTRPRSHPGKAVTPPAKASLPVPVVVRPVPAVHRVAAVNRVVVLRAVVARPAVPRVAAVNPVVLKAAAWRAAQDLTAAAAPVVTVRIQPVVVPAALVRMQAVPRAEWAGHPADKLVECRMRAANQAAARQAAVAPREMQGVLLAARMAAATVPRTAAVAVPAVGGR